VKEITITAAAREVIRANADPFKTFVETGRRNADGTWTIPVADDTYEGIQRHLLPGETVSDAIIRVSATDPGGTRAH
jgi:hypothetical protein